MRSSSRAQTWLALLGLLALTGTAARAADQPDGQARPSLPIEAFFGAYAGHGVATQHRPRVAVSRRELNVTIEPSDGGFAIAWTTVMHKGGDAKGERVVRRDNRLAFVPSGRRNLWRTVKEGDPASGETYAWARIEGDSLITYVAWIDDDGMFDVDRYARQITPAGMKVSFRLTREGAEMLSVEADLEKVAK